MPGLLLDTLNGKRGTRVPIWLMRQAGRYLPEYRDLRAKAGGFLAMAYDSALASEVTLQPIRRFGFDGAILFSDILVIPHALGQDLWFETGEGPRLAPPLVDGAWQALEAAPGRLDPIYETVRLTRAALVRRCDHARLCRFAVDRGDLHGRRDKARRIITTRAPWLTATPPRSLH